MKKCTTLMLMSLASFAAHAQDTWIDITDKYVVNPNFDNNDRETGWEGTPFGAYNPRENAEHYEKTYNSFQTISGLSAGKFRVSLSAFYRMGSSSNDYSLYTSGDYKNQQHAKLYATSSKGDYETGIAPASSAALSQELGGGTSQVGSGGWWGGDVYYIPNNMEAAYYWFEAGHYVNTLECEVGTDGQLTIGIRKSTTLGNDWTCLDNWRLEYFGKLVDATSITLSQTDVKLTRQEVLSLTATVMPENATYRNVNWTSTDISVAKVDSKGEVTAVGNGTCYIVASSKSNSTVTAKCKVTVTSNPATSENVIINEIMAANVDVYMDPSFNYGSWVELYNPTDKSVTLGGLYVSDNPLNLKKHKLIEEYGALPANGYAMLNFDHFEIYTKAAYRQIDDKLNSDGGTIIISDGTNILAQQDYPQAISRTSYARTTDGGDTWATAAYPTPGSANGESMGFASMQLDAPVVDKDAQLFSGQMHVCVNIPEGATLKFTTDGTTPTKDNGMESPTGLFNVESTTCYRFRLFKDGFLPSSVVTRSYILDEGNYPFPIISVVTDRENIYSSTYGVFQKSENGRPGRGQSDKCNWNMEWDRPVAFEYISKNNKCLVSQECNFSMCGGWSRAWSPHSFKLKANKIYDLKKFIEAPLFEKKPYIKNKTLQIRNGGNDTGGRIKDPALQMVVANSGMYVDYQEWEPVHVFINGEHYAVLNMREPNNKHFAYSNYGIDTDEMDQFEMSPDSGYVQMAGTDESFLRLIELSENAADEATYEEIGQLLDIDEYVNYMAIELYISGTDWPQNNVKGFRSVNDGKFHFVLFDLDFAGAKDDPFSRFFGKEYYRFDQLYGYDFSQNKDLKGKRFEKDIKFVTLFKNLLNNDTFRKKFIDTFCIVGGSVFTPERVKSIVSAAADKLAQGSYVYPYSSANDIISGIGGSDYNSLMNTYMKNHSSMKLSDANRQSLSVSTNSDDATIEMNGIQLPYSSFNGFIYGPVTLKAIAPAGYQFAGWTSTLSTSETTIFKEGESWRYYDDGSLDGESWADKSYNAFSWKQGNAPIGYGKNEATTTNGNLPCYYFRKNFTLSSAPSASETYTLHFTVDDGAIVYINGTEAGRYNMPSGNVSYNNFATTYAKDNPDTGMMNIDPSLLKKGTNIIAVEVHNNSTTSTDILWNASLSVSKDDYTNNYVSNDAEYTLPNNKNMTVKAIFEKASEEDMITQGITPVRVNEVSAANSMYINDYFKKNDWVELYNTTDNDIDIAGMFISDDRNKPEKFQVPTDNVTLNTMIPAHGYKVIWCDKLEMAGSDIHTGFKLAAAGGDVLVKTDTYADTLTYTTHVGTQSFGRYPDGANDTYVMNAPSIGKSNRLSTYDTLYIAPAEPDPTPDGIASYKKESGVSMAYVDGVINVKSEDAPIKDICIYSPLGMKANATVTKRAGEQFASVNAGSLPKGIYVVRVIIEGNEEYSMKFNVK